MSTHRDWPSQMQAWLLHNTPPVMFVDGHLEVEAYLANEYHTSSHKYAGRDLIIDLLDSFAKGQSAKMSQLDKERLNRSLNLLSLIAEPGFWMPLSRLAMRLLRLNGEDVWFRKVLHTMMNNADLTQALHKDPTRIVFWHELRRHEVSKCLIFDGIRSVSSAEAIRALPMILEGTESRERREMSIRGLSEDLGIRSWEQHVPDMALVLASTRLNPGQERLLREHLLPELLDSAIALIERWESYQP